MSKQITRQPTKQERRRERREEQKRREVERLRAAARRRQITVVSIIAAVVIIAAASLFFYLNGRNNTSNVPSTPVNALYPAVDNVSCDVGEQTAYHIHAHLTIYINGQPVQVPQGIGIASDSSCL